MHYSQLGHGCYVRNGGTYVIGYNHIFKFHLSKLATQVNDFTDKVLCKQKALS